MGDKKFVAVASDKAAENWIIASFGMDEDGKEYFVTSYYMKADEVAQYSDGAKADAELVAKRSLQNSTKKEQGNDNCRYYS